MKRVKKIQKVLKEGTVDDLLEDLEVQLPSFLEHVFVKQQQARIFKEKMEHLTEEEAVVQVDFAENFSCKYLGEVQSAHWSQDQVTLFTVAIWTKSGDKNSCCESHVIVSDDLKHDKTSVAVFMCKVVNDLVKGRHPNITRVWIFSDGPSSQFKNRYIAHFLHLLQGQGLNIQWNYFATSHGKGAVYGIGGTVKRMVWNAVSTRKVEAVKDACSFASVANKLSTSVAVTFVGSKELEATADLLGLKKFFSVAPVIPGIAKFHSLEPLRNGLSIFVAVLSLTRVPGLKWVSSFLVQKMKTWIKMIVMIKTLPL